jgi:Na+/alanine symporter
MWVIAVMVGRAAHRGGVDAFDIANGLMAVPNLIALLGLRCGGQGNPGVPLVGQHR